MEMINLIFGMLNSPVFWMVGVVFLLGWTWVPKSSDDFVLAAHINELQDEKVDKDTLWHNACDYDTLSTIVAVLGANKGTIFISNQQNITYDLIIPTTIALKIIQGGSLNISAGKTVTINGSLEAGLYQIFEGLGNVVFGPGSVDRINPMWWANCLPDGSTDCQPALTSAVTATPVGGTLWVPTGQFNIDSQWNIDKVINIIGEGPSSAIYINIGSGTGVLLGGAGVRRDIKWENFSIYGDTDCCENGLVIRNISNSQFRNIHVQVGTTAGGHAVWLIDHQILNYYNFILSGNSVPAYPTGVWVNGIEVSETDGTPTVSNANKFDCIIEGGTGYGLRIHTTGDDGNNEIRGTYEGIPGYGIHLEGCKGAHLHDVHLEKPVNGNELVVEDCSHVFIGANVGNFSAASPNVLLVNSIGTVVDGLRCNVLSIDSDCVDTRIEEFNTIASILDLGSRTVQLFSRARQAALAVENVASLSDSRNVLFNGSAERWTAINTRPPGSWAFIAANPTWAREGTIVKHGSYSAKVTLANTPTKAALLMLDTVPTAQLPASSVATVSGWAYIPTAGGNDVSVDVWWNAGAETSTIATITERDTWVKISFSYLVRGSTGTRTYSHLVFSTAEASAIIYLDGFSVVPSMVGSAVLFTPNADEFPIFTGTAVWDPPEVAVSDWQFNDFIVPGAVLGMVANAGSTISTGNLVVSAMVVGADSVRVILFNPTIAAINLGSSTWIVKAQQMF